MSKRQYLRFCMQQSTNWLYWCATNPSKYMRPIHVALIRIAIRRLEARA